MAEKYLNALKALAVASLAAVLSFYSIDLELARAVRAFLAVPENKPIEATLKILTDIGLAGPYIALALILWLVGAWAKKPSVPVREKWVQFGKGLFLSSIIAGAVIHIIKYTVGRERPYHSDLSQAWLQQMGSTVSDFQSFPSGHSQVCFTVAAVLAAHFPKKKILIITLAALLASTRVLTQAHFLSDVIMGATLGWFITDLVLAKTNCQPFAHSALKTSPNLENPNS